MPGHPGQLSGNVEILTLRVTGNHFAECRLCRKTSDTGRTCSTVAARQNTVIHYDLARSHRGSQQLESYAIGKQRLQNTKINNGKWKLFLKIRIYFCEMLKTDIVHWSGWSKFKLTKKNRDAVSHLCFNKPSTIQRRWAKLGMHTRLCFAILRDI